MIRKLIGTLAVSLWVIMGTAFAAATVGGRDADFHSRYQLQKMMVLSRHNLRSPLSGGDSDLGKVTPHRWFSWTSAPSELSLKGEQLETIMGQYFRRWLTAEGLITENYLPKEGEMWFYANSKQRTIATARHFSASMLPMADVTVEHKYAPESSDRMFSPRFFFMNDAYQTKILAEISQVYKEKDMEKKFSAAFKPLEKVLDFKESPIAKKKGWEHFSAEDSKIRLKKDKQPSIKGSLELAHSAAEALTLQYYEETDNKKAGFGHKLTAKEWEQIGSIKDMYYEMLFSPSSVNVNVAHPLLQLMQEELSQEGRKFTFLCGHDTNLVTILAALGVEDYSLPQAIERKTPIGAKFVIGKWTSKDGREYASLDLIYQSVDQLRNRTTLTLDNPPMIYHLKLKDLRETGDGLYLWTDLQQRFQRALEAYEELQRETGAANEAEEKKAA